MRNVMDMACSATKEIVQQSQHKRKDRILRDVERLCNRQPRDLAELWGLLWTLHSHTMVAIGPKRLRRITASTEELPDLSDAVGRLNAALTMVLWVATYEAGRKR